MTDKGRTGEGLDRVLSMALQWLARSYRATQRDVRVAFTVMVTAASIALIVIAIGVVGMYFGKIHEGAVVVAADVMSVAITVLFWRQYREASLRLRRCQRDLLGLLRLVMAFEVAQTIEGSRAQGGVKQTIIEGILNQ